MLITDSSKNSPPKTPPSLVLENDDASQLPARSSGQQPATLLPPAGPGPCKAELLYATILWSQCPIEQLEGFRHWRGAAPRCSPLRSKASSGGLWCSGVGECGLQLRLLFIMAPVSEVGTNLTQKIEILEVEYEVRHCLNRLPLPLRGLVESEDHMPQPAEYRGFLEVRGPS